jgi:hypothetical protein
VDKKMARSVVIVNFIMGGGGDYALANKIKELVIELGSGGLLLTCMGEVRNLNVTQKNEFGNRHVNLVNPIIMVAPYNLISPENMPTIIQQVMASNSFLSDTIIMIDEMDMLRNYNAGESDYREALSKLNLKSLIIQDLGFRENSIGYLPMPKEEVIRISRKSKAEIINCLDSYNLSLPDRCDLYLAYLSSSTVVKNAQVFITNTLIEDSNRKNNAVYILVARQDNQLIHFIEQLKASLNEINYTHLFSKCDFSACIDNHPIKTYGSVNGKGFKKIHVCMTKSMPATMFKNFSYRSHNAMMSGDQSLSDYLSLKHKFPYYDKQPWKDPLAEGLFELAKNMGGTALLEKIESLIVGPHGRETGIMARILEPGYIQNQRLKKNITMFDDKLYSKQADLKIKKILTQLL